MAISGPQGNPPYRKVLPQAPPPLKRGPRRLLRAYSRKLEAKALSVLKASKPVWLLSGQALFSRLGVKGRP
jgi:hypothetical protein